MVELFTTGPLVDIFPDTPSTDRKSYALHMARNEQEGFLIGIRSQQEQKSVTACVHCDVPGTSFTVSAVALVPFSKNTIHIGARSIRATAPGVLPENFSDLPINVPAGESRALYVRAQTEKEAPAGEYTGYVTVKTDDHAEDIPFTLTIYDVTLPVPKDSKMTYVCWTHLLNPRHLREVYGIEPWSEEHWNYVKNCAVILRHQRQNMINIELETVLLPNLRADGQGRLQFNFRLLDQYAEIMLDERYMGAKYLCGMHLMARDWFYDMPPGTSWSQRSLVAWIFEPQPDGTIKQVWKVASDPAVEDFHHQLFSALSAHLKEKGWDTIWMQHGADEIDNDIHYQQTKAVYQLIHHYMPSARTIDAVRRESSYTFGRELDIHVPLLWHHDMAKEAYAALQGGRTEVWQYTCLQPQFEYLSRLGDYPLAATRLLGWYNYRCNLTGFLHYAWNNYEPCVQSLNPYADASCFGSFPCDAFIVYPDRKHLTVRESVRSEAQRDAFEDYELWQLAAEKAPDTVRRLAETAVAAADEYTRNPEFLMALRVQLLQIASGSIPQGKM